MQSGIYTGHVRHRRFLPVENSFRYALFLVYADLAEMEQAFQSSPFWSVNRFNLACFLRKGPLRRPRNAARNLGPFPGGVENGQKTFRSDPAALPFSIFRPLLQPGLLLLLL